VFKKIVWHFCVCTVTHFQIETNVDQQWGTWGLKQTAGTTEVLNVDPSLSIQANTGRWSFLSSKEKTGSLKKLST